MDENEKLIDRKKGCLFGLAIGDAVGSAVEFMPRGTFEPVTDMRGGGPFNLEPGQWTDDTSMALCLAESLVECQEFDPIDQLRRYLKWYREGYFSSTGSCFDIGGQTRAALHEFARSEMPSCGPNGPRNAGNGSIMRLAPIPIVYANDLGVAVHYSGESSKTTHASIECVDACRYFGGLLTLAIQGCSKAEILSPNLGLEAIWDRSPLTEKIGQISVGIYKSKSRELIRGSGYVVDSIEAALWCFNITDSFESAVLMAANLGDDADTTAAVCGQIAGAYYGLAKQPKQWIDRLTHKNEIDSLASRLCKQSSGLN